MLAAAAERCLVWRLYMSVAALGLRFEPSRTKKLFSDVQHTKYICPRCRACQRLSLETKLGLVGRERKHYLGRSMYLAQAVFLAAR